MALAAFLGGCAGPHPGASGPGARGPAAFIQADRQSVMAGRKSLTRFDANADGTIALAEVQAGLRRDYGTFDANADGKLNAAEANEASLSLIAMDPSAPPVRDWDQSGGVSFEEFAAWTLGRFARTDADQDGLVTVAELAAPPKINRPRGGPPGMPPGGKPPGGGPSGGGPSGGRPPGR
jgi:hypothetical protein